MANDDETDKVKVHKVVLLVVDHDDMGAKEVGEVLEHNRYPNHCMAPDVLCVETREVDWNDDHPLNFGDERRVREFERLFGQPGAIFDAQAALNNTMVMLGAMRSIAERMEVVTTRNAELEADAVRLQALVGGASGPRGPAAASLTALMERVAKGRAKFPGNRFMLAALTEEVGELARALLQRKGPEEVRAEALDVAVVAIRIFEEGDATFDDITDEESKP